MLMSGVEIPPLKLCVVIALLIVPTHTMYYVLGQNKLSCSINAHLKSYYYTKPMGRSYTSIQLQTTVLK